MSLSNKFVTKMRSILALLDWFGLVKVRSVKCWTNLGCINSGPVQVSFLVIWVGFHVNKLSLGFL